MTNQEAHQTFRTLNSIFNTYNENGFLDETSKVMLVSYQNMTIKGYDLVNFLHSKEPNNEATQQYRLFCQKVLLRLSYLIHHGRKETMQETTEYFKGAKS